MEGKGLKRQGGRKSRGGCLTCKTRRVKCDETKPTCIRCRKTNYQCGGYMLGKKDKNSLGDKPLALLVPKTPTISSFLRPTLSQRRFTNDQDFQYFQVFCNTSAPHLGEYLDESLWSRIVLQASEQESFIKHAVIAIGALNRATNAPTEVTRSGQTDVSTHFEAALRHYGKSMQGIRKACEEEKQSKRSILIACLLAVCFEYSHGNNDNAVAHIRHGIQLINEWFQTIRHRVVIDEQRFLPGIIEDEIISIFSRLEIDILAWHEAFVAKKSAQHPDMEKTAMAITKAMPMEGFSSLASARKYLDVMLRQVDWFLCLVNDHLWAISEDPLEAEHFFTDALPWTNTHDYISTYKTGLTCWRTAFRSSLTQCIKSGGNDFLLATALSLRQTCSTIALNCCFGLELSYDAYTTDFRTALSLAHTLLAATNSESKISPTFTTISSILIRSLYFIAMKCRNTAIRTQALFSLQSMRRREGIWDSCVASKIAQIVIKHEDADENGFIPDSARLRAIKISFDLHVCQGKVRYLVPEKGDTDTRYMLRCVSFYW